MNPLQLVLVVACLLTVLGRMLIPHVNPSLPGTYEALAHVLCGMLLGLWMANRQGFYLVLLAFITLTEAIAFFVLK